MTSLKSSCRASITFSWIFLPICAQKHTNRRLISFIRSLLIKQITSGHTESCRGFRVSWWWRWNGEGVKVCVWTDVAEKPVRTSLNQSTVSVQASISPISHVGGSLTSPRCLCPGRFIHSLIWNDLCWCCWSWTFTGAGSIHFPLYLVCTSQVPLVAVDSFFYGKLVIAPLNILLYNVFTPHGPDLYGNLKKHRTSMCNFFSHTVIKTSPRSARLWGRMLIFSILHQFRSSLCRLSHTLELFTGVIWLLELIS